MGGGDEPPGSTDLSLFSKAKGEIPEVAFMK